MRVSLRQRGSERSGRERRKLIFHSLSKVEEEKKKFIYPLMNALTTEAENILSIIRAKELWLSFIFQSARINAFVPLRNTAHVVMVSLKFGVCHG